MAEILTVKDNYIDGFMKGTIVGVFQERCNLVDTGMCPGRNCGNCPNALADQTELAMRIEQSQSRGLVISTTNGVSELRTNILFGSENIFFTHNSGEIRLGIR
jgi:hypothetical protein